MPSAGAFRQSDCGSLCGNVGVALAVSWQPSRLVFTARGTASQDDYDVWVPKDLGLLVGYGTRPGSVIHFHAGLGLGYGEATASAKTGFAIPFEAQLAWRVLPFVGIGLYGWGSTMGPMGGVGVGLQLGKLR